MYFTPNFLPCIVTFSKIIHSESVFLNSSDVYFKQTYRNRTRILTSSGVANLIVPVHASSGKSKLTEVRIDNEFPWQRTMLRTIQTAYRNSVYYPYYDYFFEPLFQKRYTFLKDLQEDSIRVCLKTLKIQKDLNWQEYDNISGIFEIPAKNSDRMIPEASLNPYPQTFGSVFAANLSVMDLIFCKGPEAVDFLTNK